MSPGFPIGMVASNHMGEVFRLGVAAGAKFGRDRVVPVRDLGLW